MLLAEVERGSWRRLLRDREGTRLFAGLDAAGNLSPQSMALTAAAVVRMTNRARASGCGRVEIFATSASRDAANGAAFLSLLRQETGLLPRIITGEEEACLSFLGATELAAGRECGLMDIGGGSTELVIGRGDRIRLAFSCQMGAVRLFQRFPISVPADMAPVEAEAARILEEKLRALPAAEPEAARIRAEDAPGNPAGSGAEKGDGLLSHLPDCWIGTGGTFTALGAMLGGTHWTDRSCLHGTSLSRAAVRGMGFRLAAMTLEERLKLPGLQPQRADIVVHGICILLAVMDRLGIESIRVSEYGNLDGYIRKYMLPPEE